MSRAGLTRRTTLAAALPAPVAGWARIQSGVFADASPLRSTGDNTDADDFAQVLPAYIARSFAQWLGRPAAF